MSEKLKKLLERAQNWSDADVAELDEVARQIELRHSGVYQLNDEERTAIEKARKSRLISDEEVEVFWAQFGIK